MFIVKAEVLAGGPFQMYEADAVHVRRLDTSMAGSNPPAEAQVDLVDPDGRVQRTLEVGRSVDHYGAVYIMNSRGTTVERVYPKPSSARVA
jgi:hypothetical protein